MSENPKVTTQAKPTTPEEVVDTTSLSSAAFDQLESWGRGVHGQTLLRKNRPDPDDASGN